MYKNIFYSLNELFYFIIFFYIYLRNEIKFKCILNQMFQKKKKKKESRALFYSSFLK